MIGQAAQRPSGPAAVPEVALAMNMRLRLPAIRSNMSARAAIFQNAKYVCSDTCMQVAGALVAAW